MTAVVADELSVTFAALADPTRRAILSRLADGEATVGQLAEPFALTQQAISKHIKVLERAGLISRSRIAQARPCRIEPARFDSVAEWIGRHQQVWQDRYDRLDQHLAALQADGTQDPASEGST
jgi:DNA-binding transcriptional ArsR family regulator